MGKSKQSEDKSIEKETIGKRIQALRKKKGETQAQLGEVLHLEQNTISGIENEDRLSLPILMKIAEHYNVSLDYLCYGLNGDAVLEILTEYIGMSYKNLEEGDKKFYFPVIEIDSALFNYLFHVANAQNENLHIPEKIQNDWISMERDIFYKRKKEEPSPKIHFVPCPESLIRPDGQKNEWTQKDLLRELINKLLNSSLFQE